MPHNSQVVKRAITQLQDKLADLRRTEVAAQSAKAAAQQTVESVQAEIAATRRALKRLGGSMAGDTNAAVICEILENGPSSLADLAGSTGIPRATLSTELGKLRKAGEVVNLGFGLWGPPVGSAAVVPGVSDQTRREGAAP